jgi:hypothetical protein
MSQCLSGPLREDTALRHNRSSWGKSGPLPISPAVGQGGPTTSLRAGLTGNPGDPGYTTVEVANASAIASTPGSYLIQIDGEQMLVTGVDTVANTLTVVRAVNGTRAAAHGRNAQVFLATDQRGLPRVVNGHTDIGAFQTQLLAGLIFLP